MADLTLRLRTIGHMDAVESWPASGSAGEVFKAILLGEMEANWLETCLTSDNFYPKSLPVVWRQLGACHSLGKSHTKERTHAQLRTLLLSYSRNRVHSQIFSNLHKISWLESSEGWWS